jgi:CheY-specific phosphatase CheX
MNLTAMKLAMKDSISEVLEQMFFLPIDILETDAHSEAVTAPKDKTLITASVGFKGPIDGLFMLSIPLSLANSMAVDFLGTSSECVSCEQITGTVKEMINMLAGSTLSAYEPESAFNLQIPNIIATHQSAVQDAEDDAFIEIMIATPDSQMMFCLNISDNSTKE